MKMIDGRFTKPVMLWMLRRLTVAVPAVLTIAGAQAAERKTEPDVPFFEPLATTPGVPFDIAFGVAVTNDYISRGITQSNGDPAIQGYIEPSVEISTLGTAYINVWSSNVDFGAAYEGAEIDVAGGLRHEFGPLSVDAGYVHYFYTPDRVSPDYGEIFAKAEYNFKDLFTIGTFVYFAPDFNQSGNNATWVAGGIKVPLPHDFSIYGGVGYQFFEDPNAYEDFAWTAGISKTWKAVTFDVRYWGTDLSDDECVVRSGFSNGCGNRISATISIDTTWSALKDWGSPR